MALLDRLKSFGKPAYRESASARSQARLEHAYRQQMLIAHMGQRLSATYDPTTAGWSASGRHPIEQITARSYASGWQHDLQLLVYHLLRQYVPTLDAAISARRALEGDAEVTSKDEGLARMLNEWAESVPVGYLGEPAVLRGLNTYAQQLADNADEYGLSAGEILTDERGTEITRLVTPNVRTLSMRSEPGTEIRGLYQATRAGSVRIDTNPLVQVLAFNRATESPWPTPLAWSLVKTGEALLRMYEAVINGWWRFGDPSLLLGFEYDPKTMETGGPTLTSERVGSQTMDVPEEVLLFKDTVESVMEARRQGKVGDAYVYVTGGKIRNEVLGAVDQTLMRFFKEQRSAFAAQIIEHADVPPWLFPSIEQAGDGLGSARSNSQALLCAVAAHKRNRRIERILRGVIDTHLLLSKDARFIGRYEIEFSTANLLDDEVEATVRKTNAEAEAQLIENAVQMYDEDGNRRFAGEAEDYLREKGVWK